MKLPDARGGFAVRVVVIVSVCLLACASAAGEKTKKRAAPPPDEKIDQMDSTYRTVPQTYDSTSTIPPGSDAIRNGPLDTKRVNPYQPFGTDQPLYGKQNNGDVN